MPPDLTLEEVLAAYRDATTRPLLLVHPDHVARVEQALARADITWLEVRPSPFLPDDGRAYVLNPARLPRPDLTAYRPEVLERIPPRPARSAYVGPMSPSPPPRWTVDDAVAVAVVAVVALLVVLAALGLGIHP